MTSKANDRKQTQDAETSARAPSIVNQLHLPSLYISGFRGIDELNLPGLAQVTLFVGDNGVGKSTILDAVRLYASRGNIQAIARLLYSREEYLESKDEDGNWVNNLMRSALFHGGAKYKDQRLEIGPAPETDGGRGLAIETVTLDEDSEEVKRRRRESGGGTSGTFFKVLVRYDGDEWRLDNTDLQKAKSNLDIAYEPGRATMIELQEPIPDTKCMSVGPGLPDNDELARYWDEVALSTFEDIMVNILKTVVGQDLERVGVVGYGYGPFQSLGRRVMARLRGGRERMPLKSLGDGAVRLFGLALALTNSINGFLLIDEAESGIHYSHHEEFWQMVLGTAVNYNIQVLATTHSFDCIAGFARAANSIPGDNGMLVRLDKDVAGKIKTATYSEDLLSVAEEMGIEVR